MLPLSRISYFATFLRIVILLTISCNVNVPCRFPTSALPEVLQKWKDFVANENESTTPCDIKQARLCSLHFDANNYVDGAPKWKGVPTVTVKQYVCDNYPIEF